MELSSCDFVHPCENTYFLGGQVASKRMKLNKVIKFYKKSITKNVLTFCTLNIHTFEQFYITNTHFYTAKARYNKYASFQFNNCIRKWCYSTQTFYCVFNENHCE